MSLRAPPLRPYERLSHFAEPASVECRQVVVILWDYLDGRLDAEHAKRVRAHIVTCAACLRYQAFQQCFFARLAAAGRQIKASGMLRGRVHGSLRRQGWQV